MTADKHEHFMRICLEIGAEADKQGNMGVGSVIVKDGEIVGRGRNQIRTAKSPLIHAETDAIADACKTLGTDDLSGTTLYTTMEPCPMCAGAMLQAKIGNWVVGGRFKSVGRTDLGQYSIETFAKFVAADIQITSGVLQRECETLRGRFYLRK
ncbi:MAG: nucleoside deaminase [Enhydrobacter sp.]